MAASSLAPAPSVKLVPMPVYRLDRRVPLFPPPEEAEPEGLLAVGGDLSAPRLLEAYRNGIFPWFEPGKKSSGGPPTRACS